MNYPNTLTLIADSAHGLQGALELAMQFIATHDPEWHTKLVADNFDPNAPGFCWCQIDYDSATWLAEEIEDSHHEFFTWRDGDLWFDPNFELDTEPF